ncbi:MAG: hypothetical protein JW845_06810 [Dehalococcoidales bacterium]|nr:hypothetical protein [Dehalococcoidales bacterium]
MKKLETTWRFFIGGTVIALILLVAYNVFGVFDDPPNYTQLSIGLFSGLFLGVGIIGLLRTHWWQVNSRSIVRIILLGWQAFILAYTIFYMFPHIHREVFKVGAPESLKFFQNFYIGEAFCTDFKDNWQVYALFLFAIIVWLLLILPYQLRKNRFEKFYDKNKIPSYFLAFTVLCIIILLLLKFIKIDSYYFFDRNTGEPHTYDNPFIFYFLIGMFGVITFCSVPMFFDWIKGSWIWFIHQFKHGKQNRPS